MMRTTRVIYSFFLVGIILVILPPSVRGQEFPEEGNKFRLAQSFERSTQYEKAARLYEELFARNPENVVYFDGLHRMYVQLKEYEKAMGLVQRRLDRHPGDLNLLGTLGEDYFKAGKEAEAHAVWERALATDEKNQNVYRYIYNVMMQNRLFAESVEILLKGRKKIGSENLFATELGYSYTIIGNYREATVEYLRALKENPGLLSFIESRVALYTGKSDGLKAATGSVEEAVRNDRRNIHLQRLLAWLHLEGKQFENAYVVYRDIDELSKANGQELLAFANQAFKQKALEVSARAYKDVIERYPKAPILPVARFGYARVIEEQTVQNDSLATSNLGQREPQEGYPARETQSTYGAAINYYSEIVRDYPRSEFAVQSLFRIASIKFDRFFDVDAALGSLEQIEKEFPGHRLMSLVGLKAGEILLTKGELGKSAERLGQVKVNPLSAADEKDRALFALAELDYFQGALDSSLAKLNRLVSNLAADITNDALLLQQFIHEHRAREESLLKEYAHAELLERQRKVSEAIAIFEKLIAVSSTAPIVDDALVKLGELQTKMGDPQLALSTYQKLITEHPESILCDKAQLDIGEIYQYLLKDKQKAIAAYQELLEKYPNSLFLDEVRKRIRQLRGDTL